MIGFKNTYVTMSRHDGMKKRQIIDPRAPVNETAKEEFQEIKRNKLWFEINVPTSMLLILPF